MNIKHSILILFFFLSVSNLHPMQQAEDVNSDELSDKDLALQQEPGPYIECSVLCLQKRTEQVFLFLPIQLADIISAFERPITGENTRATTELKCGVIGNDFERVLSALNNFANINVELVHCNDCLTYSVTTNTDPKIIKTLLEYKANPNPPNKVLSLLHQVINPDVIPLLVEYNANVNALNNSGKNALYYNPARDKNISLPTTEAYEVIKTLIAYNVNPNHRNADGETPLHQTARDFHHGHVKALLEGKADVNATDSEGNTALHLATGTTFEGQNDNVKETLQLLINADANPYAKNSAEVTTLERAQTFDYIREFQVADYILEVYNEKQKNRWYKSIKNLLMLTYVSI